MNYNELIKRLSNISPNEFDFEARVMIENFTNIKYEYVLTHRDDEINSEKLNEAIQKRENRIPLQYIVGKWEFYRQEYFVDENCLIPRSDTEILVEKAIELLPKGARFLDLCTGSGCIAISTLAERKDTSAIMVDKFEKTLFLAQKNALHNGVENRVKALLLDILADEKMLENERFDAILSNPPYIRPEVIETLSEEVKKEPYVALYGGDDGLLFYNKITRDYSKLLKKDGIIIYEIGYDQANDITIIANNNNFNCQIVKDYGGNDRVAILTKK